MPTYIYADNYRGFRSTFFPLLQVNFLVGENSTGKSSILDLIEMLANINFWAFDPEYSIPNRAHRHFNDLVSADSKSRKSFTIGAVTFAKNRTDSVHGMLVSYVNNDGRPAPSKVSVIDNNKIRTVEGNFLKTRGNSFRSFEKSFNKATTKKSDSERLLAIAKAHGSKANPTPFINSRVGMPLLLRFSDQLYGDATKTIGKPRTVKSPPFARQFVELAPIRTKPKRTYDSPETPFSPEGEHTPYVIRKRLSSKTAKSFKDFLSTTGINSGLFRSISVREYSPDDRAPFEIKVNLDKKELTLDNVGYGVSQALPLLVEVFAQNKGATFAIQQPEVHLHPKAQAAFGEVIANISREDSKSFLIETHSDFTIDRFRHNIRLNGHIESQVLFFERVDGHNTLSQILIDKDGLLDERQPESYREFFINESLSNL